MWILLSSFRMIGNSLALLGQQEQFYCFARLFNVAREGTALQDAFLMADDVLRQVKCSIYLFPRDKGNLQGVQGISDIITIPGLVNVDFADVCAIMRNSGSAMLGVGASTGKNRAREAAMV